MFKINGIKIKSPSSLSWGISDLSSEEAKRTLDGKSHKDIIAQIRKLEVTWDNPTKEEASTILKAVVPYAYVSVTYPDAMSGTAETRKFYTGDKSAPLRSWTIGDKSYSSLSFNFVEE